MPSSTGDDDTTQSDQESETQPKAQTDAAGVYQLSNAPEPQPHLETVPSDSPSHSGPPRPVIVIVLILIIAAGYWGLQRTGWRPPWEPVEGPLTASGTLEADEILVSFEVSGRIIALVQEGQSVETDEILASLDDSLIQLQIVQAPLASRQQLEIQASRYQLHSPIGGIVTRVPMHIGEVASPGQTIAAVADLSMLDMTAYILERDLGEVRVGQEVVVTADPFPDRAFTGVVISTNPRAEFTPRNVQTQADRLNLVFGVKIRVDNPDLALKPGMPADVTFPSLPQGGE